MTTFRSDLDAVETVLASKRIKHWSPDWQQFVRELPVDERRIVGLLAALLDAKPADELATSR